MNTNDVGSILLNETSKEVTLPGRPDEARLRSDQQQGPRENLAELFKKPEECRSNVRSATQLSSSPLI